MKLLNIATICTGLLWGAFGYSDGPTPIEDPYPPKQLVVKDVRSITVGANGYIYVEGNGTASIYRREKADPTTESFLENCLKLAMYAKSTGMAFEVFDRDTVETGPNSVGTGPGVESCGVK